MIFCNKIYHCIGLKNQHKVDIGVALYSRREHCQPSHLIVTWQPGRNPKSCHFCHSLNVIILKCIRSAAFELHELLLSQALFTCFFFFLNVQIKILYSLAYNNMARNSHSFPSLHFICVNDILSLNFYGFFNFGGKRFLESLLKDQFLCTLLQED